MIEHAGRDAKKNLSEVHCGNPEWPGIEGAMPRGRQTWNSRSKINFTQSFEGPDLF